MKLAGLKRVLKICNCVRMHTTHQHHTPHKLQPSACILVLISYMDALVRVLGRHWFVS
jgi:hypothetical protein